MRTWNILLPLTLLTLVNARCLGQRTKPEIKVTIDCDTKLPDKFAPFDQWFILKIPIDSSIRESEIKNIRIFEISEESLTENYLSSMQVAKISFAGSKEKCSSLEVLAPPLRPNSKYTFSIQYSFSYLRAKLQHVNDLLFHAVSDIVVKAQYDEMLKSLSKYNEEAVRIFDKQTKSKAKIDWGLPDYETYKAYYGHNLESELKNFYTSVNPSDKLDQDLKSYQSNLVDCPICTALTKCNCQNKSIVQDVKLSLADILFLSCNFPSVKEAGLTRISRSESTIDSVLTGSFKPGHVPAPNIVLGNLSNSLTYFESIKKLLLRSEIVFQVKSTCISTLLKTIDSIITKLQTREKIGKLILEKINSKVNLALSQGITDASGKRRVFLGLQLWSIDSEVATIKSNAGNYFIPEIGLVNMVSNATLDNPTYFLRPYYAINISLRPINKDIKFKDIQTLRFKKDRTGIRTPVLAGPTVFHHMSVSIGVTQYSIKTNYPEIDDLIKEMCLMTGLNWRFTRAFRIGCGVTWYRKDNDNPVLKDKITVMPYLSLALDVDIVNWASTITDRLLK